MLSLIDYAVNVEKSEVSKASFERYPTISISATNTKQRADFNIKLSLFMYEPIRMANSLNLEYGTPCTLEKSLVLFANVVVFPTIRKFAIYKICCRMGGYLHGS